MSNKVHPGAVAIEEQARKAMERARNVANAQKQSMIREMVDSIKQQAKAVEDLINDDPDMKFTAEMGELDFNVETDYGRTTISWYSSND